MSSLRAGLGDFSSIVCFKALVVGIEETLGAQAAGVALRGAGRKRGKNLATSLGFGTNKVSVGDAARAMSAALGKDGTRLCEVDAIESDGAAYVVRLSETVCSAGEPMGSPRELSFTMGAVQGAMEVLTQTKLKPRQIGSVLRGDTHDVIRLEPM